MSEETMRIAWLMSNLVAVLLLLGFIFRSNLARFLFCVLFLFASWRNASLAILHPDEYLNYANLTPVKQYARVMNHILRSNIRLYVTFIAGCQFLIGLLIGYKGILMKIIHSRWNPLRQS
jgi:hypothetical protein